jgi:RNA polymerase sigma-70 factor (ECF subfamily)
MTIGEEFEAVLAAARTGAEWAVAALYRDLHPAVLRYLRAQDRFEAEDLDSQTWLDVAGGLHGFRGDETGFRRWVFAIARRRLIDHRRRAARRPVGSATADSLAEHLAGGDVEAEAMTAISTEAALAFIGALPPDQAEVVLLRVVGGFSSKEVAKIMGKTAGTVRVLQHRALVALSKKLGLEPVTKRPSPAM